MTRTLFSNLLLICLAEKVNCSMQKISELYIYPVKSLGGISLKEVELTDRGFLYDRRWMLVDENNRFLTQRTHPLMAMLQTGIDGNGITVFHKKQIEERVLIPFVTENREWVNVQVWDDSCAALAVDKILDDWFSKMLQLKCRLVYMPGETLRKVDPMYAVNEKDITGFSDGYPVLMIGQASLDDLNSRLTDPLPMNRFRPNIVFTGGYAFEEDEMENFSINGIPFYGVKLCSRCVLTTINQETTEKTNEPLKTLASYRMLNNKVYFGQNIIYNGTGVLSIGEELAGITKKQSLFLFS